MPLGAARKQHFYALSTHLFTSCLGCEDGLLSLLGLQVAELADDPCSQQLKDAGQVKMLGSSGM